VLNLINNLLTNCAVTNSSRPTI